MQSLLFYAGNVSFSQSGCNDIRQAVGDQLKRYPESTLQDIYKSFFQDEFGPGHLLTDTAGARNYLQHELSGMSSMKNYIAEPCGMGRNFYRVPLDFVKDGKIPFADYFAAFLESAETFRIPEAEKWKAIWERIVLEIDAMGLDIPNYVGDKSSLAEMLEKGESVAHHSAAYSERYDPHYRIIGTKQWKKLIGSL